MLSAAMIWRFIDALLLLGCFSGGKPLQTSRKTGDQFLVVFLADVGEGGHPGVSQHVAVARIYDSDVDVVERRHYRRIERHYSKRLHSATPAPPRRGYEDD